VGAVSAVDERAHQEWEARKKHLVDFETACRPFDAADASIKEKKHEGRRLARRISRRFDGIVYLRHSPGIGYFPSQNADGAVAAFQDGAEVRVAS
jgi:hypothetical protein